jgi:hypothetical protein
VTLYFQAKSIKLFLAPVRADVSLEPSKPIAELKRSSIRWLI